MSLHLTLILSVGVLTAVNVPLLDAAGDEEEMQPLKFQ